MEHNPCTDKLYMLVTTKTSAVLVNCMQASIYDQLHYTIDMERFAALNVHGFNPTGVFAEVHSRLLG